MNINTPKPTQRLRDLPLWRLLVALADAERTLGPADTMTRQIAEVVQKRLTESESDVTPKGATNER
jgi:hypothetical protein